MNYDRVDSASTGVIMDSGEKFAMRTKDNYSYTGNTGSCSGSCCTVGLAQGSVAECKDVPVNSVEAFDDRLGLAAPWRVFSFSPPASGVCRRLKLWTRTQLDSFAPVSLAMDHGDNFKVLTDDMAMEQYVLTQCGTQTPSEAEIDAVKSKPSSVYVRKYFTVPLQVAVAKGTSQLHFLEELDVQDGVAYVSEYAVGPCWQMAESCGSQLESSFGNATCWSTSWTRQKLCSWIAAPHHRWTAAMWQHGPTVSTSKHRRSQVPFMPPSTSSLWLHSSTRKMWPRSSSPRCGSPGSRTRLGRTAW